MKKIAALIIILCIAAPQLVFAGAWTLPRMGIWVEHAMGANWAKDEFKDDRSRTRFEGPSKSWGWNMIDQMEFGVTDWFTILGGVEYKDSSFKKYDGTYTAHSAALTTITTGFKLRLMKEPAVVSTQFKAYIDTGVAKSRDPKLSDGNHAYELKALIGKKWDTKIPFYMGFETGYRYNDRNVSNQIPIFFESGFWPISWLLIKAELDAVFAHSVTGDVDKDWVIARVGPTFQLLELWGAITNSSSGSENANDITREGQSLNFSVQYGNVFWGRNTSAAQSVIGKVSAQF